MREKAEAKIPMKDITSARPTKTGKIGTSIQTYPIRRSVEERLRISSSMRSRRSPDWADVSKPSDGQEMRLGIIS